MQKRKNRWYIAVAAVVILAVVLVLAVVLGKKGKNKKDPKMIEPTQQEQASEIPTETEEVFDYSATETAETKSLPKSVVSKQGILIDVDAGTILAGKDALKRMIPASMTKIFTVLVAAENIKPEQLDELVTISIDATDFSYSNDCSNTGYEVDEQVTVRICFMEPFCHQGRFCGFSGNLCGRFTGSICGYDESGTGKNGIVGDHTFYQLCRHIQ